MRERKLLVFMKGSEIWEDKLYRSMGTLKMARRLSYAEFIALASDVRLGAALGVFDFDPALVTALIHTSADGNLLAADDCGDPDSVSKLRAERVRNELN